MGAKKNFVLDTNVILHDYKCLENFQENDIYLPIAVLEELDKFKKGGEQINFSAREFIRTLDEITDDNLFNEGVSLGEDKGRLFVMVGDTYSQRVAESFPERISDHRILSCMLNLSERNPKTTTILITKDVNLRMKARSLGVLAEDYISDKIVNIDIFGDRQNEYDDIEPELIDRIYAEKEAGVNVSDLPFGDEIEANECFILKSFRNSVPVRYSPFTGKVKYVDKSSNFGILPRNVEQNFAFELLNDPDVKLIGMTGKAGTGKTLLALASALKQRFSYKQILLARPIVSLSNKDIGFLPGDEKQKISPFMQPLFDNLAVIKNNLSGTNEAKEIETMQNDGRLVIEALAFIRGRSLSETYFIIDEAQNLTPLEIKTIITRAGDGTKIIFTGDIYQIDSPYLDAQSNGLAYMIDKMKGQELFGHINLVKGERSQLSELASNVL